MQSSPLENAKTDRRQAVLARACALTAVVVIAALLRLLPHPANFSPIAAMALFGGAKFGRKALAFAIPLLALALSDAAIGFYSLMPAVYGSFLLVGVLGTLLGFEAKPARIALTSIAGSAVFFLVTNFFVWFEGGLYTPGLHGLATCYVAAIPFFQNSLIGDLLYSGVFFGGWALVESAVPRLQTRSQVIAA